MNWYEMMSQGVDYVLSVVRSELPVKRGMAELIRFCAAYWPNDVRHQIGAMNFHQDMPAFRL